MADVMTFRPDEKTDKALEAFPQVPRSDVIRAAVSGLGEMLLCAQADAYATLEVLRDRYGHAAELAAWLTEGDDGEPVAHLTIGGQVPADIVPVAARLPHDQATVAIFLQSTEDAAYALLSVGAETLLVRPILPIGELPWPPKPLRIVVPLGDVKTGS